MTPEEQSLRHVPVQSAPYAVVHGMLVAQLVFAAHASREAAHELVQLESALAKHRSIHLHVDCALHCCGVAYSRQGKFVSIQSPGNMFPLKSVPARQIEGE